MKWLSSYCPSAPKGLTALLIAVAAIGLCLNTGRAQSPDKDLNAGKAPAIATDAATKSTVPPTASGKDAKAAETKTAAADAKAGPEAKPATADTKAVPAKPVGTPPAPAAPVAPAIVKEAPLPPLKGSHIPDDKNNCIACHGETDLWDPSVPSQRRLFVSPELLKKDIHYSKGVSCVDCHGGNFDTQDKNQAHAVESHFRAKLADIKKYCAACHEKDVALLTASAHRNVSCIDCHAQADAQGKKSPHTIAADLKEKLSNQPTFCGSCHEKQLVDLESNGVHSKLGGKDSQGRSMPLNCTECHGNAGHAMPAVKDRTSPVFLENQVRTCGRCHNSEHDSKMESYLKSVHGKGMVKSGLINVAVCADCHGAHGIFDANDNRSKLNIRNVADTCAACHRGIKEQLVTSVHNRGTGLGGKADRPAPGGKSNNLPSCTSCHLGHALESPESVAFREAEPNSCGNCHVGMSSLYALSMHGELTNLGFGPAAKCADCHGAHNIHALDDPKSRLSPENRQKTCGQCHPGAGANFVHFSPHLDPYDAHKNPVVNAVQMTLLTLLFTTFGFFGLHSLLWFVRGLIEVLKHGRARGLRPGATAYVRFVSYHRIGHTIMMTSFLGLALTGLPLKYNKAPWAKTLAHYLGGFESTGFWHRFFGVILLVSMLAYLARMVRLLIQGRAAGQPLGKLIFGPDSPIPNLTDLKDFSKMLRWFVGLGPKPGLDRWAYWEKIDFWGAIADTVIIGSTGLMLWFPNFFCGPLPGSALNIAQVVHSTQALLATGFVFAIHFFNTHFRPDKFPGDMCVLTGLVSEEEFKEERPVYFQRLEREGKLAAMRTTSPGLFVLLAIRTFGFVALAVGVALLLGMIVASL